MNLGSAGGEEDEVLSTINTTPLVDVMLVLLIIFLLTIPVAIQTVPLDLPRASNIANVTKPENIVVAVDAAGQVFWNNERMADNQALLDRIKQVAVKEPQPEIHVRGDKNARFEFVGRVIVNCQRGGIMKVAFITEPDHGGNQEH
ncbi:MAG: biopolymer transporter ExbD [Parvibaculum sp.]|uniref:ExbD/TolR family protein n=1 Tax=Parvibaculum sp. TaxID=2024848 RepID=UPI003C74181F